MTTATTASQVFEEKQRRDRKSLPYFSLFYGGSNQKLARRRPSGKPDEIITEHLSLRAETMNLESQNNSISCICQKNHNKQLITPYERFVQEEVIEKSRTILTVQNVKTDALGRRQYTPSSTYIYELHISSVP
ncbi:hypothetical protein YC2023_001300 [Brassica napus]